MRRTPTAKYLAATLLLYTNLDAWYNKIKPIEHIKIKIEATMPYIINDSFRSGYRNLGLPSELEPIAGTSLKTK